jgi:hypothetical protein
MRYNSLGADREERVIAAEAFFISAPPNDGACTDYFYLVLVSYTIIEIEREKSIFMHTISSPLTTDFNSRVK